MSAESSRGKSITLTQILPIAPYVSSFIFLKYIKNIMDIPTLPRASIFLYFTLTLTSNLLNYSPVHLIITLIYLIIVGSLVGYGASLNSDNSFKEIGLGLLFILLVSIIYTLVISKGISPLLNPIIMTTGIGVLSFISFTVFLNSSQNYRLVAIALSMVALILSQSRISILASATSLIIYVAYSNRHRWASRSSLKILFILISILTLFILTITYLLDFNSSGRDALWFLAIENWLDKPIFGNGMFTLSEKLYNASSGCELWTSARDIGLKCPEFLSSIGSPWLIAHNFMAQNLADIGILGTCALTLVIAYSFFGLLKSKNAMGLQIFCGLLICNLFDNTITPPSPLYAETFWIMSGLGLKLASEEKTKNMHLFSIFLIIFFSYPLILGNITKDSSNFNSYYWHYIPPTRALGTTRVIGKLSAPNGNYRLFLQACNDIGCKIINTREFTKAGQVEEFITHIDSNNNDGTFYRVLIFSNERKFYNYLPVYMEVLK